MNIFFVIGLTIFASAIIVCYILFATISVNKNIKKKEAENISSDSIEKCRKMFEEGQFSQLEKYAQRELEKNFNNIELRKILAGAFLRENNEHKAQIEYEAILSVNKDDNEAQKFLASYYFKNGPKSRAIELYEQLTLNSQNLKQLYDLSSLYEAEQNFTKAIELYKNILEQETDGTKIYELHYKLAELNEKTGDFKTAYLEYENIIEKDPNNTNILSLLADLAFKNQFWEDCLKYCHKTIFLKGNDIEILKRIAQVYSILNYQKEAIETYKKIVSIIPSKGEEYIQCQKSLCNALIKNKQTDEAIEILKKILEQNPKESVLNLNLAEDYTTFPQFEAGVKLYKELLDCIPRNKKETVSKYLSNILCAWAVNTYKKGDFTEAFNKFDEALEYCQDNEEIYFQLARCNYISKNYPEAIINYRKAININPKNSEYYFGIGFALDKEGMQKDAKEAFRKAVDTNPNDAKLKVAYAVSLIKESEFPQAIEQFEQVLKFYPDNADILFNIGFIYELLKDKNGAIEYYGKALSKNENHKEAKHNLELLLAENSNDVNAQEALKDRKEYIAQDYEINL